MGHFTHIHFQSVDAVDVERARDFYRDVMGFGVEVDAPYGETRWIFMKLPGQTRLHLSKVDMVAKSDKPQLVLVSPDVDAACKDLAAQGVTILQGPDDAPWEPGTRWAMIHDSEGNLILIQTLKGDSDG